MVIGKRLGDADVPAETEIQESEILAQGEDTIGGVLSRLQPFIDPGGNEPIVLINGKPIGFDRSILGFPPEALSRITVLRPEAATRYGERPDKRVVNLVLKRRFASYDTDASADFATAGGRWSGNVSVGRSAIRGDTRWTAQVRLGYDDALFRSERHLAPQTGVFDRVGYITSVDGGEIDPSLSLAAGRSISIAAIPAPNQGPLTVSDFASTANETHPVDPREFESLYPNSRQISVGLGVARPVGNFSLSFSLDANNSASSGWGGLPMISLVVPAGNPWSPFARDIIVDRPFSGDRALRIDNNARSISGSLTGNGKLFGIQTSFSFAVSHFQTRSFQELGVDIGVLQQLLDAKDPSFDPFGPISLEFMKTNRYDTSADNVTARMNLQKNVLDLPAGPAGLSIAFNASAARSVIVRKSAEDGLAGGHSSYRQRSGQIGFNVPISQHDSAFTALGDLSLDLSLGQQTMTGGSAQRSINGGITWSPLSEIQLRASAARSDSAPSFDQRYAPVITTIEPIFDYSRQEISYPVRTTGGNSQLKAGSQENVSISAMLRPLGGRGFTINFGYRQSTARNSPAGFPELTPAIEAAFPNRVTRDPAGQLVALDARPINIESIENSTLNSSVTMQWGGAGRRDLGKVITRISHDNLQFELSLIHRIRLRSVILLRDGLPIIDRLDGDAESSRQSIDFQLGLGKRSFGVTLSSGWSSSIRVAGAESKFRVIPPLIINLVGFVRPGRLFPGLERNPLTHGLKVSFGVHNLLDGYRRIRLENGSAQGDSAQGDISNLGRDIRVSLRKTF